MTSKEGILSHRMLSTSLRRSICAICFAGASQEGFDPWATASMLGLSWPRQEEQCTYALQSTNSRAIISPASSGGAKRQSMSGVNCPQLKVVLPIHGHGDYALRQRGPPADDATPSHPSRPPIAEMIA